MTNIYRCNICGEAYIGKLKPSHCPFRGAHVHWLIDAKEYVEILNSLNVQFTTNNGKDDFVDFHY
jgi:hypothetical protein